MLATTLVAMFLKIRDFWASEAYLLLAIGIGILALAIWLAIEATIKLTTSRGRDSVSTE